ncbi:hypothetical protein [Jeongeupia chitinilytica]|uniref:Hydrophobin n=1 Tax=Jeongeupia chitinilytica TaxID=1041641 RepID=A0ABQ3H5R4_9NEIS|nr:hypothetical protein [Jeongeupia chitinilytica]GHD68910.1 hypothetical protein GCM10007350_34830 [Jeongeupia chitinilytica]
MHQGQAPQSGLFVACVRPYNPSHSHPDRVPMRVRLLTLLLLCLALSGRGLPLAYATATKPVVCSAAGPVPSGNATDCHDAPCCMPAALTATLPTVPFDPLHAVEVAVVSLVDCGGDAPACRARGPPAVSSSRATLQ